MQRPDGTFPGPDELGRKSFEYSGARMEFDSKFGNEEVKEYLKKTLESFEDATEHDPEPHELDLLTRGPLFTSLVMPNTEKNVDAIAEARAQAASFWLSWVLNPRYLW